jgi:hypothetical protein
MPRRLLPYGIVVALLLLTFCSSPLSAWDTSPYLMGTWASESDPHPTSYFIGNPTTKPLDVYALFHGMTGTQNPPKACYRYTIPANGVWYLTDPAAVWTNTGGPGTAKFFAFPAGTTAFDPNAVIGGFQQEVVTPHETVQLLSEDFEGTFPPAGWTTINSGIVAWIRSDGASPSAWWANPPPWPLSGLAAYVEACAIQCDPYVPYDTSLATPAFSTMGMDSVELRFDYQFYWYEQERLDLEYSTDGGSTWTLLESLPQTGQGTGQSRTVDISALKDLPSVRLRWHYYNSMNGKGYWAEIDNVRVTGVRQTGPCHIMDMNLKAVTINSTTVGEFTWLNDLLKTTGCPLWEVPLPPVPGSSFCPAPGIIAVPIIPGPFS